MLPYYILVIYIYFIVAFCRPKIGDKSNWKFYLLLLPIFIFAALRGNGKGDYFAYINRGEQIRTIVDVFEKKDIGMEIGYRILSLIVFKLRLPRQFTVIFMNIISLICISFFIRKYSKDWSMSLLLYLPIFFQFDMHAARTAVSIGICAVSYKFIKERNLVKYTICIFLACAFHSVAIISILAFFIYNKKISAILGGIILATEIVLIRCINFTGILYFLFSRLHFDYFVQKLETYTSAKVDLYGYPMKLYDMRIWIIAFIFLVAKALIHCSKNSDENFMSNCIFTYVFILILFSDNTFFAYRLSAFFYIYLVVLVPAIILNYSSVCSQSANSKIQGIRMFYLCISFFTMLNLAYATKMVEYITVFESGYGLIPY